MSSGTYLKLSNKIPVIYLKSNVYSACVYFRDCGDSIDSAFGPSGLSHMLEHIYVIPSNNYYSNGATFSNCVAFIASNEESSSKDSNNSFKKTLMLYEYITSWFFTRSKQSNTYKIKDRISKHDIHARIDELNNETNIKELHHGYILDVVESMRLNKRVMFSKFDESYSIDKIKEALHNLLDYMLDPRRIIILQTGPDNLIRRNDLYKMLNKTFGSLRQSNQQPVMKPFLNAFVNNNKDVLIMNVQNIDDIQSVYFIPLDRGHVLLSNSYQLKSFSNQFGEVSSVSIAMNNIDQYVLEVRIVHNTTQDQLLYRDSFSKICSSITKSFTHKSIDELMTVEELMILAPNFVVNFGHKILRYIPTSFNCVFIERSVIDGDVMKSIPFNTVDVVLKPSTLESKLFLPAMPNTKDIKNIMKARKTYYKLYFPLKLSNVVAAVMLSTYYPNMFYIQGNVISTPYYSAYEYLLRNEPLLTTDLPRRLVVNYIMNLRTYCLFEKLDYNLLISYTVYNNIVYLECTPNTIYYKSDYSFNNELYISTSSFNYFLHITDEYPGTYTDIIRNLYKKSGIIYYGDITMYDKYYVIKGIMN